MQARQVRVQGRVQGVGYRYACVQQAAALGISGWVRNRVDGSVEALLQGEPHQLERMCDWMRDQVPAAQVRQIDITPAQPSAGLEGFEQRPTA